MFSRRCRAEEMAARPEAQAGSPSQARPTDGNSAGDGHAEQVPVASPVMRIDNLGRKLRIPMQLVALCSKGRIAATSRTGMGNADLERMKQQAGQEGIQVLLKTISVRDISTVQKAQCNWPGQATAMRGQATFSGRLDSPRAASLSQVPRHGPVSSNYNRLPRLPCCLRVAPGAGVEPAAIPSPQ
jgi:hypothetical protein